MEILPPPLAESLTPYKLLLKLGIMGQIHFDLSSLIKALHVLQAANASHSSTLACGIPGMEEPGRLQSMGSLRVRHD